MWTAPTEFAAKLCTGLVFWQDKRRDDCLFNRMTVSIWSSTVFLNSVCVKCTKWDKRMHVCMHKWTAHGHASTCSRQRSCSRLWCLAGIIIINHSQVGGADFRLWWSFMGALYHAHTYGSLSPPKKCASNCKVNEWEWSLISPAQLRLFAKF